MKKTQFQYLTIIIVISLTSGFSTNISQIVFGQANSCNTNIAADINKEEKILNPPLSPIRIELASQPSRISEEETNEMQTRLREINEPPDIPITNSTILGPIGTTETEPNATKINSTGSFNQHKILTSKAEVQIISKPITQPLIVIENKTLKHEPGPASIFSTSKFESSLANRNDTIFYTGNGFELGPLMEGIHGVISIPQIILKAFKGNIVLSLKVTKT